MDVKVLAEILRDMIEDPAWEPAEEYAEFDLAHAETFAEAGLRGEGIVLHLPAIGHRFRLTIE